MNISSLSTKELESIDWSSFSKEDLLPIIKQLENEATIYDTSQMAAKLGLNSIYGALANEHFRFLDLRLAEAITLQGQDAIKFSERILNEYFYKVFYRDKEVLTALKLKQSSIKIDNIEPCKKPVVVYMDTDSVHADTIISTDFGNLTIKQLYERGTVDMGSTIAGHESVNSDYCVMNWSEDKHVYFTEIKRVIRHKVTKAKWKLTSSTGKEVIVTNDHSMIVFRDNKKLEVKPSEILLSDELVEITLTKGRYITYKFTKVQSIECIGEFKDEYVYDIEVVDDTHTFIANDILVHNSCYVTFEEAANSIDWTGDINEFVLTLNEVRLEKYLKTQFDKYCKYYNADNFLVFELESIAYSGIWVSKKKYVQDISWSDGKIYEPLTKIKAKGLELIQGSTPAFCRARLGNVLKWIFKQGREFDIRHLAKEMSDAKKIFVISDIEEISKTTRVNDYDKGVVDDKGHPTFNNGCPAHVRASAYYNHLLYKNKGLQNKYDFIRSSDKVKWYYSKDVAGNGLNKFAYVNYPHEFAPPIDHDLQFEKTMLNPINNIISSMGYQPLASNLDTKRKLF